MIGAALAFAALGRLRWLPAAGAACSSLGAVTLAQRASGRDLGIDEFFVRDYLSARSDDPGGLATNTAVCFVLIGIAFLIWRPGAGAGREWALALSSTCAAMLALHGQTRARQGRPPTAWIAFPCGMALFVMVLLVWQAVVGMRPHATVPAVSAALAVLVIAVLAGALLAAAVALGQRSNARRDVAESFFTPDRRARFANRGSRTGSAWRRCFVATGTGRASWSSTPGRG